MPSPPSETQRVAAALTRQVRGMAPGDDVGTVRGVAAEYGVSSDVSRRALNLLVQHGLVRAEARKHVVADPEAGTSSEETVAQLQARVEELEQQMKVVVVEGEADKRVLGELMTALRELYSKTGQAYPGQAPSSRKRRATG